MVSRRVSIDRTESPSQPLAERVPSPIDTAFLACQTDGDSRLQRDLLTLFVEQSSAIARGMHEPHRHGRDLRQDLHRLKGSACAIGAREVAEAAEAAEQSLGRRGEASEPRTPELKRLQAAITDACCFAASLVPRI